jgi:hypothetical protein
MFEESKMKNYLLFIFLIIFLGNVNAEDARFEGYAVEHFQEVGARGWLVSVNNVIDGPTEMIGNNISVYMTSANPEEYPPGFIDPNIAVGDLVSVYGSLQSTEPGDYHILLVGSKEYYMKRSIL